MFQSFLNTLFGCAHQRTTFPITPARKGSGAPANNRSGAYVVCLDCGKEFSYDWKEMRVGAAVESVEVAPTARVTASIH
ncbi:MAG TPA: hypothetical protein VHW24_27315 [Bryobacteraceae bacterium]|jgi:hypothetical protein|nr:hypothetical protein [Bryobacteraceae bacterium]